MKTKTPTETTLLELMADLVLKKGELDIYCEDASNLLYAIRQVRKKRLISNKYVFYNFE